MAPYSVFLWLLSITVASVLHLMIKHKKLEERKGYNFPPGPKKRLIVGNLHQLSSLPHRSLWSLAQKYGPIIYLQLGRVPSVVVSSAALAKEVLKTHDLDFCTRPSLVATDKFTYNRLGVSFAPYGEYWRDMRKIYILEIFSVKRVQSFRAVREEEISLMIEAISSSSRLPVNLGKLVVSLANNIICRIALGRRCEEGPEYGKSRFYRIFEEAQELLGGFFVGDFFPAMGWIDRIVGVIRKLEKNVEQFDAFYEEIIEEHLDPKREKPEQEDLVDVLLQLQKDANLTRDHVKAVIMDMFLAGTETASATLVWAMSELMRKPSVLNKAQEEVRASVGTKRMVAEDDLHQLKYLKSVVKETMRLHPPVPLLLSREAMRICKINGYDILPGTRLFINAWSIGRDPKSWENPEDFCPDRFMNSSIDFKGHDFELIPFGAGRRICPALYFGSIMIELALANLLYIFDWKLPNGLRNEDIDMSEVSGMTVLKKASLHLIATKHDMN